MQENELCVNFYAHVLNTKAQNLENKLGPLNVVYHSRILANASTTIDLPYGTYLLFVYQGGSWDFWGAALISITVYLEGSGASKFAGTSRFINGSELEFIPIQSPTGITIKNETANTFPVSIIYVCP